MDSKPKLRQALFLPAFPHPATTAVKYQEKILLLKCTENGELTVPYGIQTTLKAKLTKEYRTANKRLEKKRVQCLIEAFIFVSRSVLADSLMLRNPLLRQAPNRQRSPWNDTANRNKMTEKFGIVWEDQE